MTIEQRFWEKVTIAEGCWLWRGAVGADGYGRFKAGDRYVRAHRYSYELKHGAIAADVVIRHHCDTPLCVNPAHLDKGTQKDNIDDMMKRGRHGKKAPTHCRNGHEFTPETTLVNAKRWRSCAICKADSQRRRMADPAKHASQLANQAAWRRKKRGES